MAEEPFVNIFFENEGGKPSEPSEEWWKEWAHQSSAQHAAPEIYGYKALKKLYPNHSIVMSSDYRLNLLSFPQAYALPYKDPIVTNAFFIPIARRLGGIRGVLVDSVEYGAFRVAWDKYEFIVFTVKFFRGYDHIQHYVLHEGPEDPARSLLVAAGIWSEELHDEIWVYDKYWYKDHGLWVEVQKGNWKDVILKEEFKKALQKDVFGFFSSEEIYKELAIPWKRGLIMYGPPGNGKTISIKVIMKECQALGFNPLYVKTFQGWMGEEAAMAEVFAKARELAPCVVVLEDLDSLINDDNRSFFLNQLDGLEGNDGLLVIGTTNHFDKLDPALSGRPSRFDRKYLFDDPDNYERGIYCKYWQRKLASNKSISFPDELVQEIADLTDGFSFAYLKEAFVASLVLLAGLKRDEEKDFATVIKQQIKELRKNLNQKPPQANIYLPSPPTHKPKAQAPPRVPRAHNQGHGVKNLFNSLPESMARSELSPSRIYETSAPPKPADGVIRDVKSLLNSLSQSMTRSEVGSSRVYYTPTPANSGDARGLPDDLAQSMILPNSQHRVYAPSPRAPVEQPRSNSTNLAGVSKSGTEFTWYNAPPKRA